jgi:hypothetical protein
MRVSDDSERPDDTARSDISMTIGGLTDTQAHQLQQELERAVAEYVLQRLRVQFSIRSSVQLPERPEQFEDWDFPET